MSLLSHSRAVALWCALIVSALLSQRHSLHGRVHSRCREFFLICLLLISPRFLPSQVLDAGLLWLCSSPLAFPSDSLESAQVAAAGDCRHVLSFPGHCAQYYPSLGCLVVRGLSGLEVGYLLGT